MTKPIAALLVPGARVRCTIPGHALEGKCGTVRDRLFVSGFLVEMDEPIPQEMTSARFGLQDREMIFTADEIEAVKSSNPPK